MLDLTRDYFSLFGLRPTFAIDSADLMSRYQDIQAQIHPDRYANKSDQEQRLALQMAAFVNEAYQCLKDPLLRARYLLKLQGREMASGTTTHGDRVFLLEQMQLREQLEVVARQTDPQGALDALHAQIASRIREIQEGFVQAFEAAQYDQAADNVLKWQFLVKLQSDANRLQDYLDPY